MSFRRCGELGCQSVPLSKCQSVNTLNSKEWSSLTLSKTHRRSVIPGNTVMCVCVWGWINKITFRVGKRSSLLVPKKNLVDTTIWGSVTTVTCVATGSVKLSVSKVPTHWEIIFTLVSTSHLSQNSRLRTRSGVCGNNARDKSVHSSTCHCRHHCQHGH